MLSEPNNCDPVAWAQYNQQNPPLELEPYRIELVVVPECIHQLTLAVSRAASELEGTSEKADRIALQLITALAMFEKAVAE